MTDEDLDDAMLDAEISCPACAAEQPAGEALLGTLGRLSHYRCRFCGWQWSEQEEPDEPA